MEWEGHGKEDDDADDDDDDDGDCDCDCDCDSDDDDDKFGAALLRMSISFIPEASRPHPGKPIAKRS